MTSRRSDREWVMPAAGISVGLAAALLGSIAFLAWRIERQAMETEKALGGIRDKTGALFDLANMNAALERMTGELRATRPEASAGSTRASRRSPGRASAPEAPSC